ncbi:MAG: patatin-like protein, partial [Actinomycetota bacterium]|nr:patatin-like protein [Actinomycetota bacterium]
LRDLWFEKGDIQVLLEGWKRIPWKLRLLPMMVRRRKPPLRGDDMCVWLHDALDGMNRSRRPLGMNSLLPEDHLLELFVPITDFHGYDREIPLYDPRFVRDRTHRHVMHFQHGRTPDGRRSHFGMDYDHALAFSARATSSFPGAFPPVSLLDYAKAVGADLAAVLQGSPFFPLYGLTGFSPEKTQFIDGGVLDNFPFGSAIKAIAGKPAATDVDRRLIFIEPDPGEGGDPPSDGFEAPGLVKTVFAGYASIPRKEPIVDDLLDLANRNEAVLRVRDVIEASFPSIRRRVRALMNDDEVAAAVAPGVSGDTLIAIRRRIETLALEQANFNAATYARVRIRTVVDGFGDAVVDVAGFEPASHQAAFVAGVVRAWAMKDRLLEQTDDLGATNEQVEFLSSFDLHYHERRTRFLIAALSWLYRPDASGVQPVPRRALDVAKHKLYARISDHLDAMVAALKTDDLISRLLREIFSRQNIADATRTDEFEFQPFVDAHEEPLVEVRERIRQVVSEDLPLFEKGLQSDLLGLLPECTERVREDLLTRYLGFPFWDMLVYPLQAISGVGERDHVEVYRISPVDTALLTDQELRGMSLFHFGAFFDRKGREGDYLWGRLDAAERLIKLLLDVRGHPPTAASGAPAPAEPVVPLAELRRECVPAFRAILAEDGPTLRHAGEVAKKLHDQVERLAHLNGGPDD